MNKATTPPTRSKELQRRINNALAVCNEFVAQEVAEQAAEDGVKIRRMTRATSPACVRRIALNYAADTKYHSFRRVASSFLEAVEINALNFIKDRINRHPSRGVTLQ
jgi:hypothetical protein